MKIAGRRLSLDLTQLELLAALGDLASVSAAAARIGLSQSAASHALSKLRVLLGDPLFVRTSGGLRPTTYGLSVSRASRDALETLRLGLEGNRPFDPAEAPRAFGIYMSDVGQTVFLPPLLRHLGTHAPGITLRVSAIPAVEPGAALEVGDVDLAVGYFTTLTTGFRQRVLFRERYVCVARADHPRFARGMTLEAFYAVPHAVTTSSGAGHRLLERVLDSHKVQRRVVLAVPQFLVLPLVIASSDLMVIMPSQLAEEFARLVDIKVMAPPVRIPAYDIRIFWHERYHHDPANRWLRDTCYATLQRPVLGKR
jgi:DNA-binding transcriptional LysR family regulator